MTIVAHAEQHDVEVIVTERRSQHVLVRVRGLVGIHGRGGHRVLARRIGADGVEQGLARHAVVAVRIARPDEALVTPVHVHLRPVQVVVVGPRQLLVESARRRAAGQQDRRTATRREPLGQGGGDYRRRRPGDGRQVGQDARDLVRRHGQLPGACQRRPSRRMSASAAAGPQLPAG
ncbi:MAG: hypothetical protein R2752_08360 [Vicinamibacterales bacterium]